MKRTFLALIVCVSAFAGTTTVTDTLKKPDGTNFTGRIDITFAGGSCQPCYNSAGTSLTGLSKRVDVTAGTVSFSLEANDAITPAGTSYSVRYTPTTGAGWSEVWVVPTSTPALKIKDLRATVTPTPTTIIQPSQIAAGAATVGQALVFSGSMWEPSSIGSGDVTAVGNCASGDCYQAATANYIYAGPSTGAAAPAALRALVSADIPNNAADTSGKATTAGNADTVTNGVTATSNLGDTKLVIGSGGAKIVAESGLSATVVKMASGVPSAATASDLGTMQYIVGGGSAQAHTATLVPAATLTSGLTVRWLPIAANTAAGPTLAVNGLTAKTITKCGTTPLDVADIALTVVAITLYDGTQFQLLNPAVVPCGDAITGKSATTTVNAIPKVTAAGVLGESSASDNGKNLLFANSARITATASYTLTGTADPTVSTTLVGTGTLFLTELTVGDRITINAETRTVTAIATNLSLTVDTAFTDTAPATILRLPAIFVTRNSAGTPIMVMNDLGDVGIGMSSPGAKLDVQGITNNASTYILVGRDSDGANVFSVDTDGRVKGDSLNAYFADNRYAMLQSNNGNGIPGLLTSGVLDLNTVVTSWGASGRTSLRVRALTGNNIFDWFNSNNVQLGTILESGNVGIGTATPTKPLTLADAGIFGWGTTAVDTAMSRTSTGRSQLNSGTIGKWGGLDVGSLYVNALATPGAPTVTPTCAGTCVSTWTYTVEALAGDSTTTIPGATGTTAVNATTLDGTHLNTITWTAVTGATYYTVRRTVSGGTPATLGALATCTGISGLSCVDNGLVGDASVAPTGNTTGSIVGKIQTPASAAVTCLAGAIWTDADFIYVCTATGVLKSVAIATF